MLGSPGPDRSFPVNLRRTPGTGITTMIRRYWRVCGVVVLAGRGRGGAHAGCYQRFICFRGYHIAVGESGLTDSIGYSQKVMEHFMNPRNVGVIENPDGYGKVGNPVCGDLMEIFIRVRDDVIEDIRFRTFGCGSAIATSSMVTELARGKTLEEALQITRDDVATELDGLPPLKLHCSNLAADALHAAIRDYQEKRGPRQ